MLIRKKKNKNKNKKEISHIIIFQIIVVLQTDILHIFYCLASDTRCNSVAQRKCHRQITHRSPHLNACTTTDSSSEGEANTQRVLALGKCKLNNDELVASDSSSDMYRGTFFRPGPKIPMTFNRSTSIPSMPHSASDLIAIGTIPITSQRQTPVKPMSR